MLTIIVTNDKKANGRKPITVNGTPGELRNVQPGQRVKVAWNPNKPAVVGNDGRLWYVVEEK